MPPTYEPPCTISRPQSVGFPLSEEELLEVAAAPPSADAPPHRPENVANYFQQGKEAVDQRLWDAAGEMFRNTLEARLKAKFTDMSSSWTLYERTKHAAKTTDSHLTWPNGRTEFGIWGMMPSMNRSSSRNHKRGRYLISPGSSWNTCIPIRAKWNSPVGQQWRVVQHQRNRRVVVRILYF